MLVKDNFDANVKIKLRDGRKVLFWKDNWVGNYTLASQFPNLYQCAEDLLAKARDYMVLDESHILRGPIFRRYLTKDEGDLFSLMEILNHFCLWCGDG